MLPLKLSLCSGITFGSSAVSVADIMRRARARYHAAVRRVRRNDAEIVNSRIATALSENCTRDFWGEVKRIRRNKSAVSCLVDGVCNSSDTANLFASRP